MATGNVEVVFGVEVRCGYPYVFRWDRLGRKGQSCRVVVRGARNSALIEFEDGKRIVTSRNSLARRVPS